MGEPPAAAAQHGLRLEMGEHHEAKRGILLQPSRRVVERSFASAVRLRAARLKARGLPLLSLRDPHAQFAICQKCMTGSGRFHSGLRGAI
jgi:hypothetical protein